MKYDDLKSYQDIVAESKSFAISVIVKQSPQSEHSKVTSSPIPMSEYALTDALIIEALVAKSIVSLWQNGDRRLIHIPAENILRVDYQFIR